MKSRDLVAGIRERRAMDAIEGTEEYRRIKPLGEARHRALMTGSVDGKPSPEFRVWAAIEEGGSRALRKIRREAEEWARMTMIAGRILAQARRFEEGA